MSQVEEQSSLEEVVTVGSVGHSEIKYIKLHFIYNYSPLKGVGNDLYTRAQYSSRNSSKQKVLYVF